MYLETKAGGTKRLTKIQKTEGDLEVLKSDLARALNLKGDSKKNSEITINQLNGHIIVKVCAWQKFSGRSFSYVFSLINLSLAGLAERRNPKIPPRPEFLRSRTRTKNNVLSVCVCVCVLKRRLILGVRLTMKLVSRYSTF